MVFRAQLNPCPLSRPTIRRCQLLKFCFFPIFGILSLSCYLFELFHTIFATINSFTIRSPTSRVLLLSNHCATKCLSIRATTCAQKQVACPCHSLRSHQCRLALMTSPYVWSPLHGLNSFYESPLVIMFSSLLSLFFAPLDRPLTHVLGFGKASGCCTPMILNTYGVCQNTKILIPWATFIVFYMTSMNYASCCQSCLRTRTKLFYVVGIVWAH